jgi:hypothetical protein
MQHGCAVEQRADAVFPMFSRIMLSNEALHPLNVPRGTFKGVTLKP